MLFALAFPDGAPSITALLRGKPTRVQAYIERRPMAQVPAGTDASGQWCVEAYARMDAKLAERQKLGHFAGTVVHRPPRPIIWITYYCWAALVALGLAYSLGPWLLSDWRIGVAFGVAVFCFRTLH